MIQQMIQPQAFRHVYEAIGLQSDAIDKRIAQSKMLSNHNPDKSDNWKGGGASMAYDAYTGHYSAPLIAKDLAEAKEMTTALMSQGMAMDTDTFAFNLPSNGVPLPLLTIWTSRMIEQIYKEPTLAMLTDSWQQGAPGVMETKIPTLGYNGYVAPYNDYSMGGSTSINTDWVTRQIGYFEETLSWGTMQQAQFGIAKIDYVNKLREAMAINIAQFQNDLGFQGYTGIPDTDQPMLWGILNEPNLNAAITLPADGQVPGTLTPTTAWSGKDYAQIIRDVQLLVAQVIQQGVGTVNTQSKFTLAFPPSADAALMTSTPYGVTVIEQLRKMFKGIEFVMTTNFEAALVTTGENTDETVVMVLFDNPKTKEKPYSELFVVKWQGHRPVPMASAIVEKVSMGLGGVVLKWPMYVSYAYGV